MAFQPQPQLRLEDPVSHAPFTYPGMGAFRLTPIEQQHQVVVNPLHQPPSRHPQYPQLHLNPNPPDLDSQRPYNGPWGLPSNSGMPTSSAPPFVLPPYATISNAMPALNHPIGHGNIANYVPSQLGPAACICEPQLYFKLQS